MLSRGARSYRSLFFLFMFSLVVVACADDQSESDAPVDEDAEGAFEGELVTLVVPFSTGGGYDSYARMLAPYLEEELGADVVVQNEPGAGGLLAINNLAAAEPDGLTIAIANGPGIGGSALGEAEGVEFELGELSYLARIAGEPKVWVVGSHTPWETIEDLVADPSGLRMGATGPGASTYVDAELLLAALGLDAEIITGFEGGEEVALAISAEEVDSMVATVDSRLQLIQEGEHRALALLGAERHEDLPETPTVLELDLDGEQETIALAHLDLTEFGRPFIAPPGVPEDRLEVLRTAFENVANNPDLLEEAEQQGRPIDFMPGEEVHSLVEGLSDAPEEFMAILSEQ